MQRPAALALCLALSTGALAQELPDAAGVLTASGSVFTTEITAGDSDDYVIEGAPGMVLSVKVKAAKGSRFVPNTLVPVVEVLRPGGALVTDEQGLTITQTAISASAKLTLDATGHWRVRVVGDKGTVGAYSVTIKYTGPSLPALPLASRSFKAKGVVATGVDSDEFPFQGYSGQSFSASITIPRWSPLDPLVTLNRPNGTVAAMAGQWTKDKALTMAMPLDAVGTWRVRIVGEEVDPLPPHSDATTGGYSISVKLGKAAAPGLVPDANGQYRFTVPAAGDARIGWSLTFVGAAPTFHSFLDPNGRPVPGDHASTEVRAFVVPTGLPLGPYTLTIDAPSPPPARVAFVSALELPRTVLKRRAKLSRTEPTILADGIAPTAGAEGTLVTVQGLALADDVVGSKAVPPRILLGYRALADVEVLAGGTSVRGRVPAGTPLGRHSVVVTSTAGQAAVRLDAFEVIAQPSLESIDTPYGSALGGFTVTLKGTNFRVGKMGVLLDGVLTPVTPSFVDRTTVVFTAPAHAAGLVNFGVRDLEARLDAQFTNGNFEYVSTPAIVRITPALVPLLSTDAVTLEGPFFSATDKVFVETTTNGVFEEITTSQATYVDASHHRFTMPLRPKGDYDVYVEDALGRPNPRRLRSIAVFSFADVTAASGLASGSDPWDATAVVTADLDGDDDLDVVLSRRGGAVASGTSETRLLLNDGHGVFTDATASRMPAAGADDWRADRAAAADIDDDGFVDLVLTTNSRTVPPAGRSHTRFLMNETRGGNGPNATDRVLRDRTIDLMMPPRYEEPLYGYVPSVADNWRGLDLWVGDLDTATSGTPALVVTHDETKAEVDVSCLPYCASPYSSGYTYAFYWGGSRAFTWDKAARQGRGRYRFDANFFPRRSGVRVPILAPSGIYFPICNAHYGQACRDTFTPFTGKRVAVGDLDDDGKKDVAVLSDQVVQRRAQNNAPLLTTSSLQVGIQRFDATTGSLLTDLTGRVSLLGGDTRGDAVAIGRTGFPDGNAFGLIAMTKASASGPPSVLRLIKCKSGTGADDFEDVSAAALPAVDANDRCQASDLQFRDVDQDGDDDLVLLAAAAPSSTQSAFRILRNDEVAGQKGLYRRVLDPLTDSIVTASEHFEGDALAIGDVTGDGLLDYVVTRSSPTNPGTATRVLAPSK